LTASPSLSAISPSSSASCGRTVAGNKTDVRTAQLLTAVLTALAGVMRHTYHSIDETAPDPRTEQINAAMDASEEMVEQLSSLSGDRSLLPLSAVVVGVQRGLLALEASEPD
jgi:hypothetical protein